MVGVDGRPGTVVVGRVGEAGLRGEGGVTSVCKIEVKMEFACSKSKECYIERFMENQDNNTPLRASDSEGIILFFEGVDGTPPSSIRW